MSLPDTDRIILYDIPSTVGSWGPNTWKTRLALNYKGITYRTEWVEFPDIGPLLSARGVTPNPPQLVPWPYTLPAIYDPRTKKTIMDSYNIAVYLDETYPDTPPLLPPETRVFEAAFLHVFMDAVQKHLLTIMLNSIAQKLNPRSQKYFRESRETARGIKLEEVSPAGSEKRAEQFATLERGFDALASWFDAAGDGRLLLSGGGSDGDAIKVSQADTVIAGVLIWVRIVVGENSEEWRALESYGGGRWVRHLAFFEKWADASN